MVAGQHVQIQDSYYICSDCSAFPLLYSFLTNRGEKRKLSKLDFICARTGKTILKEMFSKIPKKFEAYEETKDHHTSLSRQ